METRIPKSVSSYSMVCNQLCFESTLVSIFSENVLEKELIKEKSGSDDNKNVLILRLNLAVSSFTSEVGENFSCHILVLSLFCWYWLVPEQDRSMLNWFPTPYKVNSFFIFSVHVPQDEGFKSQEESLTGSTHSDDGCGDSSFDSAFQADYDTSIYEQCLTEKHSKHFTWETLGRYVRGRSCTVCSITFSRVL